MSALNLAPVPLVGPVHLRWFFLSFHTRFNPQTTGKH